MYDGDTTFPAGAAQVQLKCSVCRQTLAVANVDPRGAINYRTVRPVSHRTVRSPIVETVVDETGSTTTREVPLQVLAADGWRFTGPVEQDRIRFRAHRRCTATPTVAESWLDEQVRAAVAAGQSSVSLA